MKAGRTPDLPAGFAFGSLISTAKMWRHVKHEAKTLKKPQQMLLLSLETHVWCVFILWFTAASFTLPGDFFQSSAISSSFIFTFNWHHSKHFDPAFLLNCRLWKAASEFEHWTDSNTVTFHPHGIMFSLKSAGCLIQLSFNSVCVSIKEYF